MTDEFDRVYDAYKSCGDSCTHELARGVLTADLLGGDGLEVLAWSLPVIGITPGGAAAWIRGWREANE